MTTKLDEIKAAPHRCVLDPGLPCCNETIQGQAPGIAGEPPTTLVVSVFDTPQAKIQRRN